MIYFKNLLLLIFAVWNILLLQRFDNAIIDKIGLNLTISTKIVQFGEEISEDGVTMNVHCHPA